MGVLREEVLRGRFQINGGRVVTGFNSNVKGVGRVVTGFNYNVKQLKVLE